MAKKILLNWSGGKDSALTFFVLRTSRDFEVKGLLTTVTADYDRVSMHGVRTVFLEQQAKYLNLPLSRIMINKGATNEDYESALTDILLHYKEKGVSHAAFGDIFLEDLRKYREENLKKIGLRAVFPLWKRDTFELAHVFLHEGFKAILTCVDTKVLDASFCGRYYDAALLNDLPEGIDPCGENGEFHTFVFDGPVFREPIVFKKGPQVLRENRFQFCDLLPIKTAV